MQVKTPTVIYTKKNKASALWVLCYNMQQYRLC